MNMSSVMQQYKTVGVASTVATANPHKLVAMLLAGAKDKTVLAGYAIDSDDIAGRGEAVGKAIGIIEYLRASLDPGIDAEFSNQMADLYSYMERRLAEANITGSKAHLDEVRSLLSEIEEGWNGIPNEYRS